MAAESVVVMAVEEKAAVATEVAREAEMEEGVTVVAWVEGVEAAKVAAGSAVGEALVAATAVAVMVVG